MSKSTYVTGYSVHEWLTVLSLAAFTGIGGGLGAVIFHEMIKAVYIAFYSYLLPHLSWFSIGKFNIGIILMPVIGGLIIGPIVYKVATESKGHGVPEAMEAVHLRGGVMRKRVLPSTLLASSITIGSGGSAGREGPIALIGSAIGSTLSQALKLDKERMKLLTACGAGAGIAGTFNAPLGGAFFAMEVIMRRLRLKDIVPALVSSTTAVLVTVPILGSRPAFQTILPGLKFHPIHLVTFAGLGIIFGFLSFVWVRFFYLIEDSFEYARRIPNILKPALGMAITGIFGSILLYHYAMSTGNVPDPMHYGIMGVGYNGIDLALTAKLSISMIALLGILKIIATSFTIGSGGSGGIFAPSLYIGTMLGMLFGWIISGFPSLSGSSNALLPFAVGGMAALFAGAARAPLTAIFQVAEITHSFHLLPSIAIACGLSYVISSLLLKGSSIYTMKLERRGEWIKSEI